MGGTATVAVLGVTLVVLAITAPSLLRQLARGWNLHSTFFLVVFLAPLTAIILAAVTHAKLQSHDAAGTPVLISIESHAVSDAASLIAIALALVIFLGAVLRGRSLALAAPALCLGATLLTYFSNLLQFSDVIARPLLGMLAVYLACCVGSRPQVIGQGLTAGAWLLVVVSCVVGLVFPDVAALPCNLGKCGLTGELFVGALDDENQLAITLSMVLPFVFLTVRGPARIALVGAVTALVALSGSRSSLIAIVAVVAVMIVVHTAGSRAVRLLAPAVAVGALAVLLFPLPVHDDRAFTGRGGLWRLALSMVESSPFIGLGQDAWGAQAAVRNVGANAGYSPHNLWLDALVAGGWVSALLVVTAVLVQVHRSGDQRLWVLLPLAMAIMEGFTERSFAYYDLTSTTAFFLPALVTIVRRRPRAIGERDLRAAFPVRVGAVGAR